MKQAFLNDKGEFYVKEVEPPTLRGVGAVVRTVCSFIGSGTETQDVPSLRRNPGDGSKETALSYQSCGHIVEVSPELTEYQMGGLVACNGMGYGMHGEMSYVPKHMLAALPPGVTPEEAASCNLGLTGLHAVRRAHPQLGDHVVVVGLGLVGLLTAQFARLAGARVIGTDLYDARLEKARELGVELALNARTGDLKAAVLEHTEGVGADCAIVCASAPGSSAPLKQAVDVLRRRGVLVIVGIMKVKFPESGMIVKELDITFSGGRGPGHRDALYEKEGLDYPLRYVRWTEHRNLREYLQLIGERRVDVKNLITHRFHIDEVAQAYETIIQHPESTLGVLLEYDTDW